MERPKNILLARDNFRNLDKVLASLKIEKVNGAIFDIGISSFQIDESGRDFLSRKRTAFDDPESRNRTGRTYGQRNCK